MDAVVDYLLAQPLEHLVADERTVMRMSSDTLVKSLGIKAGFHPPDSLLRQALRFAPNSRLPALQKLVATMPADLLERPLVASRSQRWTHYSALHAVALRLVEAVFEPQLRVLGNPLPTLQLMLSIVARTDIQVGETPLQRALEVTFMQVLRAGLGLYHEEAFLALKHIARQLKDGHVVHQLTSAIGLLALRPLADDEAQSDARAIELMGILFDEKGDRGARVDARGTNGGFSSVIFTPLYLASYLGKADIVRYLLSKGADMTLKSERLLSPQFGDLPEGTPLQAASNGLHRRTVEVLKQWATEHQIAVDYVPSAANIGHVRSTLDYSDVGAAQGANDGAAKLLDSIKRRGSRSVSPLPIGVDLLVEDDRYDARPLGLALARELSPLVEAQKQCVLFKDFLAAMQRDAGSLKAVLCASSDSAFAAAIPEGTLGCYVQPRAGLKRTYSPVYLQPASAAQVAPILVHEFGHHIGYARGALGAACPASFAALLERQAICFDAIPASVRSIFNLHHYEQKLHAGEYYTRLFYEVPFRLLQAGANPAELTATVDAILPGAMEDFLMHAAQS